MGETTADQQRISALCGITFPGIISPNRYSNTSWFEKKLARVKAIVARYPGAVVALSGGVDSSLLLTITKDVLGDRCIAVTAISPLHTRDEMSSARRIAKALHCKHIPVRSRQLHYASFTTNPKNRCYFCKMELFTRFKKIADHYGYCVLEGSNVSDLRDYRPGLKAIRKLGIASPFIEAGIDKKTIRMLAKSLGLPTWNKPSMACLASRVPYGITITRHILQRVAAAENFLRKLRFQQVRVRDHYPVARIEVMPPEVPCVVKHRKKIARYFHTLGYTYVTLDLNGYRTGSLND